MGCGGQQNGEPDDAGFTEEPNLTDGDDGGNQPADDGGVPADPGSDPGLDAGSDPGPEDAGEPDAGIEDAGPEDAGTDAGTDAGADAGPDAGDEAPGDDADFPDPEPDDCITDVSAGHHQFRCSGVRFETHVPEACLLAPCGLIFDLPGWGMNGNQTDANTGMRALGESFGYIVVQPSSGYYEQGDPKVHDYLLRVMAAWHTDPDRVHVTGFSMGGCQTWRFVCKHADLVASAAPLSCGLVPGSDPCNVSGRVSCQFAGDDMPSRQVPVLFAFGLNDNMGDFECAERMRDRIIDVWNMQEVLSVSEDSNHTWTRYQSGPGTVFEFIEHEYTSSSSMLGGHCYPGSDGGYGCSGSSAFVWGEAAIEFFMANPRN